MAEHKYEGWVFILTLIGSLSVVAAIALAYNLVPAADLVLTQGEWEILAVLLYLIAIVTWLFGGKRGTSDRAVGTLTPWSAPRRQTFRLRPRKRMGHDALSR